MKSMNKQQKAAKTAKKRYGKDFHKLAGSKSSGNKNPNIKGNPDLARELVKKRWDRYRELKAEQYEMEAKEAKENFETERGENE